MFLRGYVRLPAENVPLLARFYESILPFSFTIHKSKQYADTDIPGGVLAFFGPKMVPRGHDPASIDRTPRAFTLDVAAVDDLFTEAVRAGAQPQCQPEDREEMRHACIRDIAGNLLIIEGPK